MTLRESFIRIRDVAYRPIEQGKGVVHAYETTPFFFPDLPGLFQCPLNYLEAFNIADGLLINFGGLSLDFKRVYNKKLVTPGQNPIK